MIHPLESVCRAASAAKAALTALIAGFATLALLSSVPGAESPAKTPASGTPIPIPAIQKKVDFETHILPILKRNCLACHNQTDAEGDLVLETPATILKGGENGPVVVPRKSLDSLLLKSATRESKPYIPPKNNKVTAKNFNEHQLPLLKTRLTN